MRVGDVRKIERLCYEGHKDEDIIAAYKNEYKEAEIKDFIKHGKAVAAEKKKAEKAKK